MGGLAKETIDMHTQELSDYTLFTYKCSKKWEVEIIMLLKSGEDGQGTVECLVDKVNYTRNQHSKI